MPTARDLWEARGVAPEASEWSQAPGIDAGTKYDKFKIFEKIMIFSHFGGFWSLGGSGSMDR